ncbi:MAG: branched-chain amino acid ABC transporter permease [Ignavibacteriales bacterium]|nr:MAG: branched-chain amino acid ABC transporter permease [Ignavibacteriales bacterium]
MIWQIIINILYTASMYILFTLSIQIVYRTTLLLLFSHAIVFSAGAYITYFLNQLFNIPLLNSIILTIPSICLLGILLEIGIYKPLRQRKANSIILMLSSLGTFIVLQNLISMLFGDDTKSIRTWEVREGIQVWGAYITPVQIIIIGVSMTLLILVAGYLMLDKRGKAMRAVAADKELARLCGINSDRIIFLSFAIGSALAGIAGILVALDVDMTPTMGMNMLMMGVVVMIIGGVGSIWGIVLGSLLLAFAQNFGVWYISSQWQDAIAFGILLIFLLFKPEGFFGKKIRKAEV